MIAQALERLLPVDQTRGPLEVDESVRGGACEGPPGALAARAPADLFGHFHGEPWAVGRFPFELAESLAVELGAAGAKVELRR